jgi:GNAT superfamily N-acetyltransferase
MTSQKKTVTKRTSITGLKFYPLTRSRWKDFEQLFGKSGAYGGCWCMWWRSKRSEFEKRGGSGNRRAIKRIVDSGTVPGILAYSQGEAVAWCSIAPRGDFSSLGRSPVLRPLDDTPVWSIVCFFVARSFRHRGIGLPLIKAAIDYARRKGAKVIEAYPTNPRGGELPPVSSFMGIPAVYQRAGFVECARPSKSKIIMRYYLDRRSRKK